LRNPEPVVLVHSSDVHIDDDLGIGAYDGLVGLAAVLRTARSEKADVVLLAGDTFDNHRVSVPVLRKAAALIGASGMPVVMLPGNHDPALPDCLFRRAGLLDLAHVHVLGVTVDEALLFDRHELEIWGHAHRAFRDMAPLRGPRPRRARWQVAMAHGHYVAPADLAREAHRGWKLTNDDIAATGADYLALGHWDRPAAVGDGRVPAYYSGSPDLARTVNRIGLDGAGVTVERIPLLWP
jgi:DNA repair exonuclease SbcCD nuclease subunit